MKKDDFIYNVEKWLVRNDVSDEEYMVRQFGAVDLVG